MTKQPTPRERILAVAADLGLRVESTFVPFSQSRHANRKPVWLSLNWRVRLMKGDGAAPVLETDYSAGSAHCPASGEPGAGGARQAMIEWECENGKPGRWLAGSIVQQSRTMIDPDPVDVLASLALDSDVVDYGTFEAWADNYGYDTDSRSAEAIYRQCLENELKLRAAVGEDGLARLRSACEGY